MKNLVWRIQEKNLENSKSWSFQEEKINRFDFLKKRIKNRILSNPNDLLDNVSWIISVYYCNG